MSKYPLIKAMGLYVEKIHDDEAAGGKFFVVYAAELERALEKAPVVQSISSTPDSDWSGFSAGRSITHTARLLCVQPAKAPDTAESLLREALDELSAPYFRPHDLHPRLQLVLERSRRLLEGK